MWGTDTLSDENRKQLAQILVPNFGARYSGVTSVIRATLPHLRHELAADLIGRRAGALAPNRSAWGALLKGYVRPEGVPYRVWHARRTIEVIVGLCLRSLLRQPLRIVFTSARQRPYTRLTHWLIRHVDRVIVTTPEAGAFVRRSSHLVPHGIDGDVFHPAANRAAAWAALGLGGRHGIGVFGRVRPQKGTDLFIEALIRLLPRYPSFTAIVVGLTKPRDAGFLAEMKARVTAAGLASRVHFLGERPAAELPGLLASVSICVAPQRHEGFGLVPLEAAASGTPVVATRVGAAETIIDDGRTGLLVDPEDMDSLTDAIERLMSDEALREEIGAAARVKALEAFAIEREVAGYFEVYRALWAEGVHLTRQIALEKGAGVRHGVVPSGD
jgi:mannosyltransferase